MLDWFVAISNSLILAAALYVAWRFLKAALDAARVEHKNVQDQLEILQNIDVSLDRIAYYLDQREEVQK